MPPAARYRADGFLVRSTHVTEHPERASRATSTVWSTAGRSSRADELDGRRTEDLADDLAEDLADVLHRSSAPGGRPRDDGRRESRITSTRRGRGLRDGSQGRVGHGTSRVWEPNRRTSGPEMPCRLVPRGRRPGDSRMSCVAGDGPWAVQRLSGGRRARRSPTSRSASTAISRSPPRPTTRATAGGELAVAVAALRRRSSTTLRRSVGARGTPRRRGARDGGRARPGGASGRGPPTRRSRRRASPGGRRSPRAPARRRRAGQDRRPLRPRAAGWPGRGRAGPRPAGTRPTWSGRQRSTSGGWRARPGRARPAPSAGDRQVGRVDADLQRVAGELDQASGTKPHHAPAGDAGPDPAGHASTLGAAAG